MGDGKNPQFAKDLEEELRKVKALKTGQKLFLKDDLFGKTQTLVALYNLEPVKDMPKELYAITEWKQNLWK